MSNENIISPKHQYAVCPKCFQESKKNLVAIAVSYGKMPEFKYSAMMEDRIQEVNAVSGRRTLKETVLVTLSANGRFLVRYGCTCIQCGFAWYHSVEIDVLEELGLI